MRRNGDDQHGDMAVALLLPFTSNFGDGYDGFELPAVRGDRNG